MPPRVNTLKTHWAFRIASGNYACCQVTASGKRCRQRRSTGPLTDDPALVTCKTCRKAVERLTLEATKRI